MRTGVVVLQWRIGRRQTLPLYFRVWTSRGVGKKIDKESPHSNKLKFNLVQGKRGGLVGN